MNRRHAAVLLFALTTIRPAAADPAPSEAALIERLIDLVGSSKEVVFVRNGSAGTPEAAAKHLRDKYAYFRKDIQTADDFIRLCGSRSEATKKPYEVRFADGHVQPSGEWFEARLKEMRTPKK